MAKSKIDFKGAATKAAGHVAGAFAYTQVNKIGFMQKQTNPKIKGLISMALGYLAVPMIAEKMKLGGKGSKGEFIQSVGEGMGIVGAMQLANALKPGLVPAIAGVDDDGNMVSGYEENPVGLITEEDGMAGLEDDDISGYEESPIRGMEEEQMYASNGIVR